MLTAIFSSVVFGWIRRRLQELLGAGVGIIPIYLALPIEYQDLIKAILTGQGGGLSISTYLGFGLYLFTQWQSLRSTTKNQVVLGGKRATDLGNLPVITLDEMATQIQKETGVRPKNIPDFTK